ncbi:MAG TPA: hypothetical protein VGG21_01720 [Acidimicrobiales bacterium]
MNERAVVIEERLRSGWLAAIIGGVSFVYLVIATVLLESAKSVPAVPLIVLGVVFLGQLFAISLFLRIVVRVVDTEHGRSLEILYGPAGLVRQYFDAHEIESASTREILSYAQTGGFGYRGSLRLFRRAALVTHRGEALQLTMTKGRRFTVSVDDVPDFVRALAVRDNS